MDHGHHAGKAVRAINDAVAMAKAVDKAASMISKGRLTFIYLFIYLFSHSQNLHNKNKRC